MARLMGPRDALNLVASETSCAVQLPSHYTKIIAKPEQSAVFHQYVHDVDGTFFDPPLHALCNLSHDRTWNTSVAIIQYGRMRRWNAWRDGKGRQEDALITNAS